MLCLSILAALLSAGCSREKPVRVVLVTLDTLRHDRFEGESARMPRLRELAREGVVFDQFYAATSSTLPTHASLFTGLHPWKHGIPRNGTVLAEEQRTLAERLRDEGFRTAAAVASYAVHGKFELDQGFDVYLDEFEEGHFNPAEVVTREGLNLLDGMQGQDHFLWLHYFDPHPPYGASAGSNMRIKALHDAALADPALVPPLLERIVKLYDHDVAYLDESLARVLRRVLDERDRYETHVVVTADHGESFGEHGAFGHGKGLWRPQVHVPTVVWSDALEPGTRLDVAGSVDVLPTLLSLLGRPAEPDLPGRDLTRPGPDRTEALGMRRTFVEPFEDVRADGSVVRVFEPSFYRVRDGLLSIGNRDAVSGEGATEEAELRELFAALEAELEAQPVQELTDEETQAGLGDLGYTR